MQRAPMIGVVINLGALLAVGPAACDRNAPTGGRTASSSTAPSSTVTVPSKPPSLDADAFCSEVFGASEVHLGQACSASDEERASFQELTAMAQIRAQECTALLSPDASKQRVSLSSEATTRCAAQLAKRSWRETLVAPLASVEACRGVVVGRSGEGAACQSSLACEAGLHCAGATEVSEGSCQKPRKGHACDGADVASLFGDRGLCAPGTRCRAAGERPRQAADRSRAIAALDDRRSRGGNFYVVMGPNPREATLHVLGTVDLGAVFDSITGELAHEATSESDAYTCSSVKRPQRSPEGTPCAFHDECDAGLHCGPTDPSADEPEHQCMKALAPGATCLFHLECGGACERGRCIAFCGGT